ncbi:MAG: CvpA family protein [Candidatus Puniceispirillales bacterium]
MLDLSILNAFDYAVLVVLAISGVLATFRGMTREFMGLAGWGVAVLASRLFQPLVLDLIEDPVGNESAADILAFAGPFVIIVILWYIFANIISPGLKKITFGNMDRPLGFIFGVIRGFVLIAVVYMGGLMFYDQEEDFPVIIKESVSIMPTRIVASTMAGFAPEDFREDMLDSIPEQDVKSIGKKVVPDPDEVLEDGQSTLEDASESAQETLLPDEELSIPGITE